MAEPRVVCREREKSASNSRQRGNHFGIGICRSIPTLTSPRVPLYLQILAGLTLGVATGVLLGNDASVLGEIGRLVIQLVKLFAVPLLLFAILDAFLKTEIAARAAG